MSHGDLFPVTFKPLTPMDEEKFLGGKPPEYGWRFENSGSQIKGSPFDSTYGQTLNLLNDELRHLEAENIIFQIALRESDIRLDGKPRSSARAWHPGVVMSFDCVHGALRYGTAAYYPWTENVRAIALSLEALRKVDRYEVSRRGEQYAGYRALPAAGGSSAGDTARGGELVAEHGGLIAAMKAAHPDQGGDPQDWRDVLAYRDSRV